MYIHYLYAYVHVYIHVIDDKPHAACWYWRHIVHVHIEGNVVSHHLVRKRVCGIRCIRAV